MVSASVSTLELCV